MVSDNKPGGREGSRHLDHRLCQRDYADPGSLKPLLQQEGGGRNRDEDEYQKRYLQSEF